MSIIEKTQAALAWLEQHPLPDDVLAFVRVGIKAEISIYTYTKAELREVRRAIGPMRKREQYGGGGLMLTAVVDGIEFDLYPPQDACRQVQVGVETRTIEKATATETVTEEVPVYEWECDGVLVDEDEEVSVDAT